MGKIATIISGKGGTGKTSVAANLGAALSLMGQKTIVVDGDAGLRNLDLLFGLEDKIEYDLSHLLSGQVTLEEALQKPESFPNLSFVAAGLETQKFPVFETTELIRRLKEVYAWVIIDCPAGLGDFFRIAVNQADLLICIVNPDIASVQNGRRALAEARQFSKAEPYFVLNKAHSVLMQEGESMTLEGVASILPAVLLGVVPYDRGFLRAANLGQLLMLDDASAATAALRRIARRLLGERVKIILADDKDSEEGNPVVKSGPWSWLKKLFN